MTKRFLVVVVALVAAALGMPVAQAQTAAVKGVVKDTAGKPMVGVTVQLVSKETGHKYSLKTNNKGEFFSLGIDSPRHYDISVIQNGQTVITDKNVPLSSGENTYDIDLSQRAQAQAAQMTEAQKQAVKEREEVEKENVKIKGLNDLLAQAQTAQTAGNYDQAVSILHQAVQADATHDILWMRLADAERMAATKAADKETKTKQLQDSVEAYKKAVALKQEKPTASSANIGDYYNNMADSYYKLGMVPDAVNAYQQAIQANPAGAATYYFNLGAVYTNSGKPDLAIEAFDKCIAADPTRADAYYQKGVNLLGKAKLEGDKMVAPPGTAEALNKYLELQPTGQFADVAKQMLASIGAPVETTFGSKKPAKKK